MVSAPINKHPLSGNTYPPPLPHTHLTLSSYFFTFLCMKKQNKQQEQQQAKKVISEIRISKPAVIYNYMNVTMEHKTSLHKSPYYHIKNFRFTSIPTNGFIYFISTMHSQHVQLTSVICVSRYRLEIVSVTNTLFNPPTIAYPFHDVTKVDSLILK